MIINRIENMKGGWFIGNFEPSVFRTSDFEVGHKLHKVGETWDKHYHKRGVEVTYLLRGKMRLQLWHDLDRKPEEHILVGGDVFVIHPGETVFPEFIEDCEVIVVKTPSDTGDKYVVD